MCDHSPSPSEDKPLLVATWKTSQKRGGVELKLGEEGRPLGLGLKE